MIKLDVIKKLGFDRAISVPIDEDYDHFSESQQSVLSDVKYFGIDKVYFSTDAGSNSHPSIFLKEVDSFNSDVLFEITNIHRLIWNYKKVLFFYVYSDTEIRIYNCSEKPLTIAEEKKDLNSELKKIELKSYEFKDKRALEELSNLFSTISVDSGVIWTIEEAYSIRKKINLQRRVDKYLVKSLINTAKQLQSEGLDINTIHKIIMRSLFLLYLEDRGGTDEKFYSQIKNGAKSYFDILDNDSDTYTLFNKLQEHFNGNVFTVDEDEQITVSQLKLIKKCFISGNEGNYEQIQLFDNWRLFDFSIIQIELLSEIYENFLSEINPELKHKTGTYYTPPSLVELILNDKLSVSKQETNHEVKILDPSCGSGIFLVQSFKRLVKRHENKHGEKLTDFNILKKILLENIYGIEIHPQSIKVTAFSLYLALVDNLNPKTLWQNKNYRLPYLINNPNDSSLKEQGNNLYCRDTIETNKEIESIEFDLVVGNPPFGTKDLLLSIRNYCDQFGFAKEMVLPFLHKSIKFSPKGDIALIFNTKVLTNTGRTYSNFRQWLFNDCYVERIYNFSILRNAPKNFGGQLFGSATGPISIVYYNNVPPKKISDKITYYAPKTYIKSNIIEGVSIDSTDIKYIPRKECKDSNSKIWKIAMWGGMDDFFLINKLLLNKTNTIKTFIRDNNIESGVGFQLLTQKKDIPKYSNELANLPYLDASRISNFYTKSEEFSDVRLSVKSPKAKRFYKEFYNVGDIGDIDKLDVYRRYGDFKAYKAPHLVVKKGLEDNQICSSLIDEDCSFRDGVYGFYSEESNSEVLEVLMSYFNSKLSTYFLFMTISSYGIEREQIMKNEYLSIPFNLNEKEIGDISRSVKSIISDIKDNSFLEDNYNRSKQIAIIEEIIHQSFNLNEKEIVLLNDRINYGLDLFHNKQNSKALFPVLEIEKYATILNDELNKFLEGQGLFANILMFNIKRYSPLMLVKIVFSNIEKNIEKSNEELDSILGKIDKHLWDEKATNIYFRKKLNYKKDNEVYLIRPNQRRFWTQSMALEDSMELILEILNDN